MEKKEVLIVNKICEKSGFTGSVKKYDQKWCVLAPLQFVSTFPMNVAHTEKSMFWP